MKTTAVVESLSYYKTNVMFQKIPTYYKWSFFLCKMAEYKVAEFKMADHQVEWE